MFQSPFRQDLVHKVFPCRPQPPLAIVGSLTTLTLHSCRQNMLIALRAVREDDSVMQQPNLWLYLLLIPQWRTFRRAGCTHGNPPLLAMYADQSVTMKHIIYRRNISSLTCRDFYAPQLKQPLKGGPVIVCHFKLILSRHIYTRANQIFRYGSAQMQGRHE